MGKPAEFSGVALLVEDDAGRLRFLGDALEGMGFSVRTADRGSSALESCRSAPQVVLSKLRLRDLSALELVRSLRSRGVDAPAVLLSDEFTREELEGSVGLSRVCCLTLPLRLTGLIDALERLLRPQDARR